MARNNTHVNTDQLKQIDALNEKAWKLRYTDMDASKNAGEEALKLAEEHQYDRGQAYANLNLAVGHFLRSENRPSLELCSKAMLFFIKHTSEKGYPATLIYTGYIYESIGDYERALEQCQRAYQAAVDIDYKECVGEAQSVLGLIYSRLSDHDRALKAYEEGLRIREELGDKQAVASSLNRIARSYTLKEQYDKALVHYNQSLKIREQMDDRAVIAWTYLGLASTYEAMDALHDARHYYQKILDNPEKKLSDRVKLQAMLGLGRTFYKLNLKEEALQHFVDSLNLADKMEAKPLQVEAHNELADYYESVGEFEKTLQHYKKYRSIREEILNDETRNRLKNQEIAFAVEKTEKEKEIFQLRNVELKSAYDEIHQKNQHITESINYASRIQAALLPQHENLSKIFRDHFVLFLPRDMVSGDFYWCVEMEKKVVIAAVDCTGHGVPGALMSMLGISFLNEIVVEKKYTSPGEILGILRQEVIKALRQSGGEDEQKEGMDMALCAYDFETMILEYAGAYNPLYLIREGNLEEYKADRMPISYYHGILEPFNTISIKLREGDQLYLFSDGFADQVGGPMRKKFKYRSLREFLIQIHQEKMEKQKELLHQKFMDWKGDLEQYDDVVILGIRI